MIELTRGNLLEADVEALGNTVNTVEIMSKGIALQFKQAFPEPRASAAAPPPAAVGCRSFRWTPRGEGDGGEYRDWLRRLGYAFIWSLDMHRTTLNFPESLFRKAKVKAAAEGIPLSEVVRHLLGRWVTGEVDLEGEERSRRETVERARGTFGLWKGRDPDAFLAESRAALKARDREIEDARLAP
jgi:hypothetical protein